MSDVSSKAVSRLSFRNRLVSSLLAAGVAGTVAVLAVTHLASDLWLLAATDEIVANTPALPIDAPAVTAARVKDQVSTATSTAAAPAVLEFEDWNYTQFTGGSSPFFFDAPNGFDFFNPLFTFSGGQPVPGQSSNPFGFNAVSPFGFTGTSTGTSGTPAFFGAAGPDGTFATFPVTGTSSGAGATPFALPIISGVTFSLNITFGTTGVLPMCLGTSGISHTHGFGPIVIIIVNVNVTSPVSPSK